MRTLIGSLVAASLALTACTSSDPAPDSTGKGGRPEKVVIATDLPLQGAEAADSEATNKLIRLYLESKGNRSGDYEVELREYDNSTSEKGAWDSATCARNAQTHVTSTDEVAVMGAADSGCSKIIVPVLNLDPNGPMPMVSHASTNPGLTKTWDPGEPRIFYPTGERSFARVVTTDDVQGAAAAQFMRTKAKARTCFVLNDGQTYGQGVAKAFIDEAERQGIDVLGNETWDVKRSNFEALFAQIKRKDPDCIYLGGIFANKGEQVVRDKVEILGSNKEVPMMAPDGFTGFPELQAMPEAEGMLLTLAGLDLATLTKKGPGAALAKAYEAEYGEPLTSPRTLYGVAATQVILKALAGSDGSRSGVRDKVFKGAGITIPAAESAIGKAFKITPKTGDVNNRDITVLQISDGKEKVKQPWTVD